MHVLVIKTSSMGDILHTLPALTDASRQIQDIQFDWIVEDGFSEIPSWHPAVHEVIRIKMRQWQKHPVEVAKSGKMKGFLSRLRHKRYDHIIDAQGLMKSGLISFVCRGKTHGLNFRSAREGLASWCYQKRYAVNPKQHAIVRTRQLFAYALGYSLPDTPADANIQRHHFEQPDITLAKRYVVLLPNTTWETKHWPEAYWVDLVQYLDTLDYQVYIPWNSVEEKQRAIRISQYCNRLTVLPRSNLSQLAAIISGAKGVVAVDTGLGHLTAALDVPCLSLYGPTDPHRIGTLGKRQQHLAVNFKCAPCKLKQCNFKKLTSITPACYETINPSRVITALDSLLLTPEVAML